MKVITVKVPMLYVFLLDRMVSEGLFGSRSEAVRYAISVLFDMVRGRRSCVGGG